MQTPVPTPASAHACTRITFEVDPRNLEGYTDEYVAQLWHISQANPAPFGDRTACEFAEHVGREIIRRFVTAQRPALWVHQGRHLDLATRLAGQDHGSPAQAPARTDTIPPAPGAFWPAQGGTYAGLIAGRDGKPGYHLIVAPADQGEFTGVTWGSRGKDIPGADSYHDGQANTAAMAAAGNELAQRVVALTINGHSDWHLPSQGEAHLQAANLKDEFNQNDFYWTSTRYSAYGAWGQYFGDGLQLIRFKDAGGRARAVRRLPLQSFDASEEAIES